MAKAIPKTVHWTWLQGVNEVPDHLKELTETFTAHNKGYEIVWWDETAIRSAVDLRESREAFDNAADYVPGDAVMQMKADIARYAIVREHGGLALDLDYHWLKPVTDLVRGKQVVLGEEVAGQWIACGFLASIPKHTLFTRLLAGIPENLANLSGRGLRANALTGTKYLTRTVQSLGPRKDIHLLPPEVLHPVPWNRPLDSDNPTPERFPDSYSVHQWNHQRFIRKLGGPEWQNYG